MKEIYEEEEIRIGCCWINTTGNIWIRRNSTVACDSIRCEVSTAGAPCPACIKTSHNCSIPPCRNGKAFSFKEEPIQIFRNIFPPPVVPASTPLRGNGSGRFDYEALLARLGSSGTRPAPLIWKSIETNPASTKKRKATERDELEKVAEKVFESTERMEFTDTVSNPNHGLFNSSAREGQAESPHSQRKVEEINPEIISTGPPLQFIILPPLKTHQEQLSTYQYPTPLPPSFPNWSQYYPTSSLRDVPPLSSPSSTFKPLSPYSIDSVPSTPPSVRRRSLPLPDLLNPVEEEEEREGKKRKCLEFTFL